MTGGPPFSIAEALAVAGARIVAIGDRRSAARVAGPRAERIDCRGGTVLPGIIDPHLHLFGLATRDAHLDCADATTVDGLLEAVGVRAMDLAPGEWVRGEGLDDVAIGRLPTAAELERAAPRNPVRLRHRSRHASVLSASALARLAIRDGAHDGLVAGREDAVGAVVGPLPPAELARGLARASTELAARGVTTVADATPRRPAALIPLRRAIDAAAFAQRVFAMRPWNSRAWRGRGRLQPGPVKIMVEETPTGLAPDAAELARRIRVAALAGAQVAVHCVGAATLVAALDAFAGLPVGARRARRHRLEHLGECPPPFVGRIAALDLMVVTNPAFVYWRGDVYRSETAGAARAWLYRARSLVEARVTLAAASDAPVVPPDPWLTVAAARSRRTRGGHVLAGRERLDAAHALALVTTHAGHARRADRLGRLTVGAPADVIVVTPDPLRAPAAAVRETAVQLTMIDGRIVWRA